MTLALLMTLSARPAIAQAEGDLGPAFNKAFDPAVIGPGSTSMLVFTIDGSDVQQPVEDMAFTDNLPAGMTLAAPAFVSNDCGGTVSAPDGGTTVSLTDGMLGLGQSCTIVVNVTAGAVDDSDTDYDNISSSLTTSVGSGSPAEATLTVDIDRPGFSKSFAPATVPFGGRSTLTFLVDNSLNAPPPFAGSVSFTDTLPAGMSVATPPNASHDCGEFGQLTANPGSSVVNFAFGSVAANSTCTLSVDVIGGQVGLLGNVSGNLDSSDGFSGKATAVLEVTGFTEPLTLQKTFTDDPVPPGGTVTLEFTVNNQDRDFAATDITFDDDLEATLTGLTPSLPGTPDPPCGAGSSLAFDGSVLSLTGGSLAPESSCTFSVELSVPSDATPGTYTNTTTEVMGTIDGEGVTGNTASDLLFVVSFPILTKEFIGDPVGAGSPATLQFTITNPESGSTMSGIEFLDELTDGSSSGDPTSGFLPFPVSVTLPPVPDPPCGPISSLALVSAGADRQALELTGGSLAEAGMPGDSCTFSVTLDIPAGFAQGTYTNTTESISGVLDDLPGPPTVVGPAASDTIDIVGAPDLSKEFTDDPVAPGGTVTLEFTLAHDDQAPGDATGVTFTDDLDDTLSGLTATGLPLADLCGPGNGTLTGSNTDTLLTASGVTLTPGESCIFSISLSVPGNATPGVHSNETSEVAATVAGLTVTGTPAEDDLVVTGLTFSKEFTNDPVIAGDTVTLSFTLDNAGATDATAMNFTDDLDGVLPGLAATGLPQSDVCGAGSLLTGSAGNTFLTLSGGNLLAGTSCTFDVTLNVPPGAEDGQYPNGTSNLGATIGGSPVSLPPASDVLVVDSNLLELTKEFTNDPVAPGATVTLAFTLTNLHATDAASAIVFSDDLGAALAGLTVTSVDTDTCGGTPSGVGTDMFGYTGGSLGAGATCSISLTLTVPPGPLPGTSFVNTTSGVTGMIAGLDVTGDPASDTLEVDPLTLTKSFDGPTVAGGTAILTFTIENLDGSQGIAPLSFGDDLDAVLSGLVATDLPPTPPCGPGSTLSGTGFLTFSGGDLGPGASCTFDVEVTLPANAPPGDFLNTTSPLTSSGLEVASPATAFLTVEPPPAFDKVFVGDSIPQGAVSVLTFTIDNTLSSLAATDLDFTDTLPAALVVATPANAGTDCAGGTITADPGTGVIAYTGGTVAANDVCTLSVDVTGTTIGMHVNVTGDLTSSSGNSGTATDTLEIFDGVPPQIVAIGSVFDTGDGELEECETAGTEIFALTAEFDEAMFNPGNDTDPNSVTNPDNWLVVGSGPDLDLSTTVCGPLVDDDVAATILEVTYSAGTLTAAVQFDGSLADGPYRLIACSGGLTDESANALDGDGDGTGGDDFVRYFRVDRIDALANGHFDCGLEDWVPMQGGDSTITHAPAMDVDGAGISGSAGFSDVVDGFGLTLGQCLPVAAGGGYEFSGSIFFADPEPGAVLQVLRSCEYFADSACTGASVPPQVLIDQVNIGNTWLDLAVGPVVVPKGFSSAICEITLRRQPEAAFDAFVDDLSLDLVQSPIIFADGFESGDTSAWSTAVP